MKISQSYNILNKGTGMFHKCKPTMNEILK